MKLIQRRIAVPARRGPLTALGPHRTVSAPLPSTPWKVPRRSPSVSGNRERPCVKALMNVLVVESPAKAKTINKYLGSGYKVLASFGHIRDLPPKDGSVKPDEDFAMTWEVDARAQKRIKDIADAVKWRRQADPGHRPRPRGRGHLLACAGGAAEAPCPQGQGRSSGSSSTPSPRIPSSRPSPIRAQINEELVDAYLARRALDYLVGFTLSPVLWRKLPGARSAGPRAIGGAAPGRASARPRSRPSGRRNTGRSTPI